MSGGTPKLFPTTDEEWNTLQDTATSQRVMAICYHHMANTTLCERCPESLPSVNDFDSLLLVLVHITWILIKIQFGRTTTYLLIPYNASYSLNTI
jgi:hypothetical protein